MNERIKELAEQQGMTGPNYLISSQELAKFAELLVRESLKVGEDYSEDFYHFKDEILKHFGVES